MLAQFCRKTVQMIKSLAGESIFSAKFIKRTDGSERLMVCRLGVKKELQEQGRDFDPEYKALLSVYDMQKKAYRFINLATVFELRIKGKTYIREKFEWIEV